MSFDPADPIGSVFADIIGRPAWNVKKGLGSFITFEFGDPHLDIREPIARPLTSDRVRKHMATRGVYVHGDWHLWIYCCDWRIYDYNQIVAQSLSQDQKLEAAADTLDGQVLLSVEVAPAAGTSRFTFDLGGVLETAPWEDPTTENWSLQVPGEHWLAYRADGQFSWHSDKTTPDEMIWQPLPTPRQISSAGTPATDAHPGRRR